MRLIFDRQLAHARKVVSERLQNLRTAQESMSAWIQSQSKIHPFLREDIDDKMYEAGLRDFLASAEGEAWFYAKKPLVRIAYEQGVPIERIAKIRDGVEQLAEFGIHYEVDVVPSTEEVNALVRRATDNEGRLMLDETDFYSTIRELADVVRINDYRPGIVLITNRPATPDVEGITLPHAVIMPKGDDRLHPVELTATHEMIHYLGLDGRTNGNVNDAHCRNPCYMNGGKLSRTLCDMHASALEGFHQGVRETLETKN